MIKVIGKRLIIPDCDRFIGYEGDHSSKIVVFLIHNDIMGSVDDVEATNITVLLKMRHEDDEEKEVVSAVLLPFEGFDNAAKHADYTPYYWVIGEDVVARPGCMEIQLYIESWGATESEDEGTVKTVYAKWYSEKETLIAGSSLIGEEYSLDASGRQLKEFKGVADIIAEHADNIKRYTDSVADSESTAKDAADSANNASVSAQGSADEAKGYSDIASGFASSANEKAETAKKEAEKAQLYSDEAKQAKAAAEKVLTDVQECALRAENAVLSAQGYADSAAQSKNLAAQSENNANKYSEESESNAQKAVEGAQLAEKAATSATSEAENAAIYSAAAKEYKDTAEMLAANAQNSAEYAEGQRQNAAWYASQAEQWAAKAKDSNNVAGELLNTKADKAEVFEDTSFGWSEFEHSFEGEGESDIGFTDSEISDDYGTFTIHCAGQTLGFDFEASAMGGQPHYIIVNGVKYEGKSGSIPVTYMESDIIVHCDFTTYTFSNMIKRSIKGMGDISSALAEILALENQYINGGAENE